VDSGTTQNTKVFTIVINWIWGCGELYSFTITLYLSFKSFYFFVPYGNGLKKRKGKGNG